MMATLLAILGWTAFGLAIAAGLVLDFVGLFGNWIILSAMAGLWAATGFVHFGWWGLGGMLLLAVLGEIIEMVAAGYGASKFGGGKGAMVAAFVGCLVGAIVLTPLIPVPLVGTMIGACLGAFVGAALYEYIVMEKKTQAALWTGVGAALGKVAGVFAKVFVGVAMLVVAVLTYS
ncbi:MAG: DUF456 domain-containing protein [Candidatus Hydrogenedentes bacterium]|nr:DUF456 domain-containing protein [Candidatus Hydrogenedentota bacterium]